MKISRLGAIALLIMLLMPSLQVMAADLYTAYKTYQDPVARAAVIERMKAARAAGQERLQERWKAGKEYIGEKTRAGIAYAQERGTRFKEWVKHNEGKIIAATAALTAILIAAGTVEHGRQEYRAQILQKFRDHGVDLSRASVRDYCYKMGALVNSGSEKAFRKIFSNPEQSRLYEDFKRNTPGFAAAMADLGGVSRIRVTPSAAAEATHAQYGTYVQQNPWYRP